MAPRHQSGDLNAVCCQPGVLASLRYNYLLLPLPTYTDGQVLQQPLVPGQLVLQVVHGDPGAALLTGGTLD